MDGRRVTDRRTVRRSESHHRKQRKRRRQRFARIEYQVWPATGTSGAGMERVT